MEFMRVAVWLSKSKQVYASGRERSHILEFRRVKNWQGKSGQVHASGKEPSQILEFRRVAAWLEKSIIDPAINKVQHLAHKPTPEDIARFM